MLTLQVIACIGIIKGAFLLFQIRLNDFTGNIFHRLLDAPKGIREEILEETKRRKKSYFRREIEEVQAILKTTDREELFPLLCTASLLLFAAGAAIAVMIGNVFLVPVLACGFLFLPFWYIRLTASHFKKDVSSELETALSIITTAYLRSEDILTSVEENLEYLNPPVKTVFADFVSRIRLIDPDLEAALEELKGKIENDVFMEWVDALKSCLYDRSLKTTLTPIVAKLSDMRIVNAELEYLVFEPRKEFITMVVLAVGNMDKLKLLQTEVLTELIRSKLNVDKLLLRQKQGFLCVHPAGRNVFLEQFERALPASSVANLFPFNYSGKTDKNGFYIGRDKFGSNVIVDFNQRADDKTNANILILGNSGQGKSYLLKLIQTILRESGMKVICLDPEHEYVDLTGNLGGCFVDLMSGEYIINVLEPKTWDENGSPEDTEAPYAFRCSSKLSQHISFLKDFFRSYKNFTDSQLDTIEIMLAKLYEKWNIGDDTDFGRLTPKDYPILSDLYDLMEEEYKHYDAKKKQLYTAELLQEICLGLHSMCKGAESKFFNGHTNITDSSFLTFGVKGLLQASKNVKDAMLFNVLSYMSNELLTNGHTAACIDEFYLFLTNLTAVEYIRNFMKRVRKKDSAVILASQNLEDFNIDGIREYTKPLFSIPTHVFLFNAGNIDSRFYIDTLQLEQSEYNLIRYPQRGVCLYKCGNERYNLMVHAPEYKEKLFGSAGGR